MRPRGTACKGLSTWWTWLAGDHHPQQPPTLSLKLATHLPLGHTNLFQSPSRHTSACIIHTVNNLKVACHHIAVGSTCLHDDIAVLADILAVEG